MNRFIEQVCSVVMIGIGCGAWSCGGRADDSAANDASNEHAGSAGDAEGGTKGVESRPSESGGATEAASGIVAVGGSTQASGGASSSFRASGFGGQASSSGGNTGTLNAPLLGGTAGTTTAQTASACGNSRMDLGEDCDDGNAIDGDGCDHRCEVENQWPDCPNGCTAIAICGDARRTAAESCDDGNVSNGDGCSSSCSVEPGYYCPYPGQPCFDLTQVSVKCGDGVINRDLGEQCDVGPNNGQGKCDARCHSLAFCGDGSVDVELGESCDNGINDGRSSGCNPDCTFAPYCGDGVKNGPEECDFGSQASDAYGGCREDCTLGPHCGDGIRQSAGGEQCDEGSMNGTFVSSCSSSCLVFIGP